MSIEDKGNKETCTDVINISGSFIEVREEKIESLPKGTYLFIESAGKKNYIPIDDFKNLDPRIGKQRSAILSTDPDVISDTESVDIPEKMLDFVGLMRYLVKKINIDTSRHKSGVIISSDSALFLELPWEQVFNNEGYVIRQIPCGQSKTLELSENNILLLISNACRSDDENSMKDISKGLRTEITAIYDFIKSLVDDESKDKDKKFWIDNVLLSRHTTMNAMKKFHWDEYKYLHFTMHGGPNGELYLESPERQYYKYYVEINISDLLTELRKGNYHLVYLSTCHSGGKLGKIDEYSEYKGSLAFQLAQENLSAYVVGYQGGIKTKHANSFSSVFYKKLFDNSSIEDAYLQSLIKYRSENEESVPIPILYKCKFT